MWVVIIRKDFTENRGPSNGVIDKMAEEKWGGNEGRGQSTSKELVWYEQKNKLRPSTEQSMPFEENNPPQSFKGNFLLKASIRQIHISLKHNYY